jgi:predicted DNA-binding helix-hairpin-helix protein
LLTRGAIQTIVGRQDVTAKTWLLWALEIRDTVPVEIDPAKHTELPQLAGVGRRVSARPAVPAG